MPAVTVQRLPKHYFTFVPMAVHFQDAKMAMQCNAMHKQMNKEHFINTVRALKRTNSRAMRCNAAHRQRYIERKSALLPLSRPVLLSLLFKISHPPIETGIAITLLPNIIICMQFSAENFSVFSLNILTRSTIKMIQWQFFFW